MIIMSLMKEKWQREAREEVWREQTLRELRESWEREAQYRETIRELRIRLARFEGEGANGEESV